MSFNNISPGKDISNDFNIIIEIPTQSDLVEYEADKETGLLFVDRSVNTDMRYPANYGFISQTLPSDGDLVDVLIATLLPLIHGCVMRCRASDILKMTSESGVGAKLVAAPVNKLSPTTAHVTDLLDVDQNLLDQIKYLFKHYKALEAGEWVKVEGWGGIEETHKEIADGIVNCKK